MKTLTNATIHKYKCIENAQSFDIEPDITVLVRMNESGKTSILEALAKVNYFEDEEIFRFNLTHDYPRKHKKTIEKSGEDSEAVTLHFIISDELASRIASDTGVSFSSRTFSITKTYENERTWNVH
jgi:recombinational DNA repair ATPase RecF